MKQEQIQRTSRRREEETAVETQEQASEKTHNNIKEMTDRLLDEIDLVLEADAEQFALAYQQLGGE